VVLGARRARRLADLPGYGAAIVDHHRVPYRDFPVEYPPGALPAFVVPAFFDDYATALRWLKWPPAASQSSSCSRSSAAKRRSTQHARAALVGSLILSRFDLWPALLVVAALAGVARRPRRHRLGLPRSCCRREALAARDRAARAALVSPARHARSALAGVAVAALAFVPVRADRAARPVAQREQPGIAAAQVESPGAALLTTFGHPRGRRHGSQNLRARRGAALHRHRVGRSDRGLDRVRARAARATGSSYAVAAVCAFVAFDKVLSPQYLLWLIPLVPLVRGARGIAATMLLTVACVLTQVWFPQRYFAYADTFHLAGVVLARDLVLVALFVVLVMPRWARVSPRTP
jgi:hypothetical protein